MMDLVIVDSYLDSLWSNAYVSRCLGGYGGVEYIHTPDSECARHGTHDVGQQCHGAGQSPQIRGHGSEPVWIHQQPVCNVLH
jgi:hypothetical protein